MSCSWINWELRLKLISADQDMGVLKRHLDGPEHLDTSQWPSAIRSYVDNPGSTSTGSETSENDNDTALSNILVVSLLLIEDLLKTKGPDDLDTFADYLLNKIKRDDVAVTLKNGYIMSGHRCFIINDNFYTRNEARKRMVEYCKALQ